MIGIAYRFDPFYRNEAGQFVPKPAELPLPVATLAPHSVRTCKALGIEHTAWRVRCVQRSDLSWRVQVEPPR